MTKSPAGTTMWQGRRSAIESIPANSEWPAEGRQKQKRCSVNKRPQRCPRLGKPDGRQCVKQALNGSQNSYTQVVQPRFQSAKTWESTADTNVKDKNAESLQLQFIGMTDVNGPYVFINKTTMKLVKSYHAVFIETQCTHIQPPIEKGVETTLCVIYNRISWCEHLFILIRLYSFDRYI